MFLAIDAGNSNVVFALYDRRENRWKNQFRLETNFETLGIQLSKKVPLYFLEHGIGPQDISQIGYSSVVPEINKIITDFCVNFLGKKPYLISAKSYSKLPVKTSRPQEMGTDLMCNVMAGFKRFQRPVIIVDFGTALTFTVINENGEVLGVNIVPGIKTAIKSLFSNTSKLPEVALKVPESAIGKNTIHAIQAGIFYGYSSLIKGMLETISQEAKLEFKVIATGGLSAVLTPLEKIFDEVDRNLTLEGLRLITEANT
ncbi:MAG: type III pantothenate kinase [Algoriphagus sp.]|uniref:type III pantothenate kinase n=1 Tax=Algoriphagus sp. TaxID=1872435 RepID=UPI00262C2CB2|nr:type III pantothenate kinase [Algoriphagus sp.]MDG1277047.1 type III pantothenate kinase [Algoriphagus sp.]